MNKVIYLYFTLAIAALISAPLQASTDASDKYAVAEHLLDGVSFEYFYQTGGGLKISFDDGLLGYEWISGQRKGNKASNIPYQSRKIGERLFIVNWQEKDKPDFVTLVIDLKHNTMYSSAILRYGTEQEVIHFNGAIIERLEVDSK
ncbi:MoaF-related domain-containing protein [Thalassotalea crassostreae]|uniref:MoaF-related domain-containing protein n=1 Tax=Thalassotalea crassostreae TaxID=1763536 RepID=UPI0008385664|nr:hypothetical protein [Thalassotalea crassostreae]